MEARSALTEAMAPIAEPPLISPCPPHRPSSMPNPGVTLAQVEIAPSLFTWPAEQPQLIGSRCDSCAALTFPVQSHCPSCGGTTSEHHLPRTGTLHTWTTQEFPPVAPPYLAPVGQEFQPYGIVWVDLQGEIMSSDARRGGKGCVSPCWSRW